MKKRNRASKPAAPAVQQSRSQPPTANRVSLVPKWIREYRFLAVILSLALTLGIYETTHTDLPESSEVVPPEWLMDSRRNLAKTLLEVYPNRSQGHLLRAFQAGMCWEREFRPEVCQSFSHKDLRDVREALQAAMDCGGAREQEQLLHFYAFILVQLNEPQEEVDAAVAQWRKHYPNSRRPDPRGLTNAAGTR